MSFSLEIDFSCCDLSCISGLDASSEDFITFQSYGAILDTMDSSELVSGQSEGIMHESSDGQSFGYIQVHAHRVVRDSGEKGIPVYGEDIDGSRDEALQPQESEQFMLMV